MFHNEELRDLFSSSSMVRTEVSRMFLWDRKEMSRNACRVVAEKPLGMPPLERRRLRWENNMMMLLRKVGCEEGMWMEISQNRVLWRALVLMLFLRILVPESWQ
jgi:hypothetical protein